jgi:hypothetical protein
VRRGPVLDLDVGALYHLAVSDALRHHFRCPDPRLELLGPVIRIEPDEVLVLGLLGRPGVVFADVPGGVSSGVSPRIPHVPQYARGLRALPLAVVGHKADLRVLASAVVGRADLPPVYQWQTRNGGVVLSDVLDLMYI